ncbi:GNAT family N-acetyltransferase [Pontixanthobacter sp.]|uniref:GNAT family N-acetyltransferase n=1 Tax=Pontixanthobacter sp. TaxID=2792078 RepID=UPI003C7AF40A
MAIEGITITRRADDDDDGSGEYHAHIDGTKAIGRLTWVRRGDARAAEHTLVPREIGGRGVAAQLVDAMVADAREQGFKIVPECSYVARKFAQNPQWSDVKA